jgi:hypothetical protein
MPLLQRGRYHAVPVLVVVVAILLAVVAVPERLPVRAPTKLVEERVLLVASNFKVLQILIGTLEPELHRGTYQAEPVVVAAVAMLVAVVAIPVKLP